MVPQHGGARMPKIESADSAALMSPHTMHFPQPFAASHSQNLGLPGGPTFTGPTKSGPLQRQESAHDAPITPSQDQFRMTAPRTPQLVSQVVGRMQMSQHTLPQTPVGAQPGLRSPAPKASQPTPPQSLSQRDAYQEIEKPLQRWSSVSSEPEAEMQMKMVPHSPAPSTYLLNCLFLAILFLIISYILKFIQFIQSIMKR